MTDVILSLTFAYSSGFCFGSLTWCSCLFQVCFYKWQTWVSCCPSSKWWSFLGKEQPWTAWLISGLWAWHFGMFGILRMGATSAARSSTPLRVCICWIMDPNPVLTGFKMGDAITEMKEADVWRSNQRGMWNRSRDRSQGPFLKRSDLWADSRLRVELVLWECVTRVRAGQREQHVQRS